MKKSREEVLQQTKLRLREKYDMATIELVESHFWITLRHYITKPLEVYNGGIQINRFFKLSLRFAKMAWQLENNPRLPQTRKELYKQLIEKHEQFKKKFSKTKS